MISGGCFGLTEVTLSSSMLATAMRAENSLFVAE